MAMLLQYRNGQLIPVKVDANDLGSVYSANNQLSYASRACELMNRSRASVKMYSKLMFMFAAANVALVAIAVKMFA